MTIQEQLQNHADELAALGFVDIAMWPTFIYLDNHRASVDWTVFGDFEGKRHQFRHSTTWEGIMSQARQIVRCDPVTREQLLSL